MMFDHVIEVLIVQKRKTSVHYDTHEASLVAMLVSGLFIFLLVEHSIV